MRSLLLAALVACSPVVQPGTTPGHFDEDLPRDVDATATPAPAAEVARAEAPPGKGARTGTIARARLDAILDAGPGALLRQFEVTPDRKNDRFVGWQLVQFLDPASPLATADLAPGDVLLAVNDQPLSRPDQLQKLWESLRKANAVTAQLWRGDQKFELRFTIDPPAAP